MIDLPAEVKITPKTYLPIVFSLLLSWVLTILSSESGLIYPRPVITPAEEPSPMTPPSEALTSPAPYLNTFLIIGLITFSGLVMLYLARKRLKLFRILVGSLIWLLSFGVTVFIFITFAFVLGFWIFRFWIPVSVAAASIIAYLMLSSRGLASSLAASYLAAGAGAAIGMGIPYWTFFILTVGISIYDILAVYKGHLSTLTKEDASTLKGLTVEVGDLIIGLGDLFFYSLTLSAIQRYLGFIPAIPAFISLLIGYTITILALRKHRILPGLPIPLLLALGSALLTSLLLSLA